MTVTLSPRQSPQYRPNEILGLPNFYQVLTLGRSAECTEGPCPPPLNGCGNPSMLRVPGRITWEKSLKENKRMILSPYQKTENSVSVTVHSTFISSTSSRSQGQDVVCLGL